MIHKSYNFFFDLYYLSLVSTSSAMHFGEDQAAEGFRESVNLLFSY